MDYWVITKDLYYKRSSASTWIIGWSPKTSIKKGYLYHHGLGDPQSPFMKGLMYHHELLGERQRPLLWKVFCTKLSPKSSFTKGLLYHHGILGDPQRPLLWRVFCIAMDSRAIPKNLVYERSTVSPWILGWSPKPSFKKSLLHHHGFLGDLQTLLSRSLLYYHGFLSDPQRPLMKVFPYQHGFLGDPQRPILRKVFCITMDYWVISKPFF